MPLREQINYYNKKELKIKKGNFTERQMERSHCMPRPVDVKAMIPGYIIVRCQNNENREDI